MQKIMVYYEICENWVGVDPITHESRVERLNVQLQYGYAVDTVVRNTPTGFGTSEPVSYFIVAKPDGTFDEVRVNDCRHNEPIYKEE